MTIKRLLVGGLGAALLWATPAAAQSPFPLGQPPPRFESPEKNEASDKGDTPPVTNDKVYEKVERPALPEGPATDRKGPVAVVELTGIVNPGMGEHIIDAIARANDDGAQLLLLELNTPGGLVSTTEKIVQAMLAAEMPVVVYVTPSGAHAASAGTFITMAAHIAVMAPATRIGAAHPVTGSGKDPEAEGGKHMAAKVENDLLALVEGIAKVRHRNAEWAHDAVKHSVSATAERAEKIGVVDLVAQNRSVLLEKLEGYELMLGEEKVSLHPANARIVTYEPSLRMKVLNLLANPGIAMLLGVLGLIGIMIEIYNPGLIVPGVMGALCILCSLIAVEQLPIDVGAAILAIAGVVLLVTELYTPSFGALGLLGTIALTIGLMLLVDLEDPDFALDPSINLSIWDVLPMVLMLAGVVVYLSYFVIRRKKTGAVTGSEGLVGAQGHVLSDVGPEGGQVFVSGEYWRARATETIKKDEAVEVVLVNGLELEVKRRHGTS